MIAPEVRRGSNGETGRLVLLRNNLFAAALIFLALQIWRPHFFLTDDNLDGGFPFFAEMGRHLLAGRSPYFSDYLFGGHYNMLRDPTCFCWHPLYFAVSLLSGTPLRLWMVDLDAFGLLMLAAAGFVNLAWYLRRELALRIGDGWIMFYTLSFTYSMIAVTTGTSWLNFLGSHSALPWLALGILQRSWRASLGLIALFSLHQILGSHLEPTISDALFLSLFAVGVAWARRSWQPVACWAGGYTLAVIVLLPLLVPLVSGFLASARSHGVDLTDMGRNNIPMALFPTSIFCGMALWMIHAPIDATSTYTLALGSSAAAWCLVPAVIGRGKWTPLQRTVGIILLLAALMICRPRWISEVLIRLPVLNAMRWPFRDLLQFVFFLHLMLVIRPPAYSARTRTRLAAFSLAIFLVPMLLFKFPPTFNPMATDRDLFFTGGFDRYWSQVRPLFQPGDRVVAILPMKFYSDDRFSIPYSLLSTYNYSCITEIVNAWGYSQTPPLDEIDIRTHSFYPFGAYLPEQKPQLMAEHPEFKFITLESVQPLRITLSSRDGPTIDLTPFIPADIKAWPVHVPVKRPD